MNCIFEGVSSPLGRLIVIDILSISDLILSHYVVFPGFGLEAPTDEAMWTRARNNAISGKQILLKQGDIFL